MKTKSKVVADQMSLDREERVKDQEEGEVQAAADLVAVRVDKHTRKGKIVVCVHLNEEVEVVAIVIEEGNIIQDQNQDLCRNQIVLGHLAINDGLMTNMTRVDTIDQRTTGINVMKDAILGTGTGIETIEIIVMREIVIDQEIEEEIGEAHKQGECVDGKMKTTKHQIANFSDELEYHKLKLIKNQSKVQSPSTKEQRESQAKNEILVENMTKSQQENLPTINGSMTNSLMKKSARHRNETAARVVITNVVDESACFVQIYLHYILT